MGLTSGAEEVSKRGRAEKVVVFSFCFTFEEVNRDPTIILKVKDDLKKVCSPFGETKRINLFDGHPKGVCSVSFLSHEGKCVCFLILKILIKILLL